MITVELHFKWQIFLIVLTTETWTISAGCHSWTIWVTVATVAQPLLKSQSTTHKTRPSACSTGKMALAEMATLPATTAASQSASTARSMEPMLPPITHLISGGIRKIMSRQATIDFRRLSELQSTTSKSGLSQRTQITAPKFRGELARWSSIKTLTKVGTNLNQAVIAIWRMFQDLGTHAAISR